MRSKATILVAGIFWQPNQDDHWFSDGPEVSTTPPYDPDWRFATGAFSDLLLYDRDLGTGDFYFHEPLPPPIAALDGYVTSTSSPGGTEGSATGSVVPGEPVSFQVSSQVGPYSITIFQQYALPDGTTEREVANLDGLPKAPEPLPISRLSYRDGAGWPAAARFTVPEWPSGVYLARVSAQSSDATIDLPFVVRARPGQEADVLVVLADTTYNAYNEGGGRNAYGNVSGVNFAGAFPSTSAFRVPFGFQLSFERPSRDGWGNVVETWELPFLRWLAWRQVPFDVCTSRDLHFGALNSSSYRLVMFAGHHEYWTAGMRAAVESRVRSGGNVAFLSGNVCWWQVRLSPDGRQMECYKVEEFDPESTTPGHALTTGHWFSPLVNDPETTLTGVSWNGSLVFYDADHTFTVKRDSHWAFAGTGFTTEIRSGSTAAAPSSTRIASSRPTT